MEKINEKTWCYQDYYIREEIKMKAYTIAEYSMEITRKELKENLKGLNISDYTRKLMGLVIERDTSPNYKEGDMGIYFTDEVQAWGHAGSIYDYGDLFRVEAVAVESCEIDDDGEFIDGSDYDWDKDVFQPEDLQKLHDRLF